METWLLQNKVVTYEDETHTYKVDGVIVPSITQVIASENPDQFKNVAPETLIRACVLGTAMHKAIEDYEMVGIDDPNNIELRNYKFLKKVYGFEHRYSEIPILINYKGYWFAGRLDEIIAINGKLGINDFKRQSILDQLKVGKQLNLYRLGVLQTYGWEIDFLRATQLKGDIRKFFEISINESLAYELLDKYIKLKEKENRYE